MKHFLRKLSFIEGASLLLLLFVAMPIKYLAHEPIVVSVVGMIHGVLFLILVGLILIVAKSDSWSKKFLIFALISTTIPFGMFALEKKLKAKWD